ncbi:uncharacterized protein LACBIDRAFT_303186 [Laccaria bicolor S238N-H82]|uniref:Predicted protein n=1 Tax=Laccaria bicolor (strain S238N-H82 / ATCC MYA-4686) TaxID=486041 RepID=B0DJ35_LACBS|nr:uncharacterized protein LACBIDRAFT_303186 [Laccaria bicolor S238N-H82]EDR05454.1 predicted protein [Laccaria bicolor S238N-H82]|eukprot:XP_001884012.1 predicted protein [Laccaria bicolor S238N-H82]
MDPHRSVKWSEYVCLQGPTKGNRSVCTDVSGKRIGCQETLFVKYGLIALIEAKKAALVVVAHDVDSIELIVFLPAVSRKMGVPYVIPKVKCRLETVVHKKTAALVDLQEVQIVSFFEGRWTTRCDSSSLGNRNTRRPCLPHRRYRRLLHTDTGRTWIRSKALTPPNTFAAQVTVHFHPNIDNLLWTGNRGCSAQAQSCHAEAQVYSRDNGRK